VLRSLGLHGDADDALDRAAQIADEAGDEASRALADAERRPS
jgi:hypothetical protein